MIPKIIHLFWFGNGKKSKLIVDLNDKLKILEHAGYEVIEWTEENYDVYKNDFTTFCYNNRKWAHLSDYARLDVLFNYGGIYLDQDVEVIKSFDNLLNYSLFIGFMFECNLGTAVIGAEKGNDHIKNILKIYKTKEISVNAPNNDLFTTYFINSVSGFKLNGKEQLIEGIKIYEKNVFEQPSFLNKKNYTIHHFDNSWKNKSNLKRKTQKFIRSFIGLYLYRYLMCRKSLKISPFYKEWKKYQ
ncbi:glycosyltransferase family 32 protein [Acinetobacter ursingii]|uniref:glycosyltransferase family 32 protein n=1 Tax=Acinetobacter ursingii TaxID=108980 RepID=UPI00125028AC|nr:glycosyltransferase [Acinetobacter ursingii]